MQTKENAYNAYNPTYTHTETYWHGNNWIPFLCENVKNPSLKCVKMGHALLPVALYMCVETSSACEHLLGWCTFMMHAHVAARPGHNAERAHKRTNSLHPPHPLLCLSHTQTHTHTHTGRHSFTQTGGKTINRVPMMWCCVWFLPMGLCVWLSKWREREREASTHPWCTDARICF